MGLSCHVADDVLRVSNGLLIGVCGPVERLRQAGARPFEAEEVALKQYILLPPEPGAGIPKDQEEEWAERERWHQAHPPAVLTE